MNTRHEGTLTLAGLSWPVTLTHSPPDLHQSQGCVNARHEATLTLAGLSWRVTLTHSPPDLHQSQGCVNTRHEATLSLADCHDESPWHIPHQISISPRAVWTLGMRCFASSLVICSSMAFVVSCSSLLWEIYFAHIITVSTLHWYWVNNIYGQLLTFKVGTYSRVSLCSKKLQETNLLRSILVVSLSTDLKLNLTYITVFKTLDPGCLPCPFTRRPDR